VLAGYVKPHRGCDEMPCGEYRASMGPEVIRERRVKAKVERNEKLVCGMDNSSNGTQCLNEQPEEH